MDRNVGVRISSLHVCSCIATKRSLRSSVCPVRDLTHGSLLGDLKDTARRMTRVLPCSTPPCCSVSVNRLGWRKLGESVGREPWLLSLIESILFTSLMLLVGANCGEPSAGMRDRPVFSRKGKCWPGRRCTLALLGRSSSSNDGVVGAVDCGETTVSEYRTLERVGDGE